ncbi:MAG: hypothetical protein J2P31_13000, partial [Blastocatellia bacterium]|nr:hypothetical protein [Blastocatellia bacterium]
DMRVSMSEHKKGDGALKGRLRVTHKFQDNYLARGIKLSLDGKYLALLRSGKDIVLELEPGCHRLLVDNTLHSKTVEFEVEAGEQVYYRIWNKRGFGSWLLDVFGSGPMYLAIERAIERVEPGEMAQIS